MKYYVQLSKSAGFLMDINSKKWHMAKLNTLILKTTTAYYYLFLSSFAPSPTPV